MRKLGTIILFCLIVTSELVFGKDSAKIQKANKSQNQKGTSHIERIKRSLDEEDEKPFWANRGKKQINNPSDYTGNTHRYGYDLAKIPTIVKERDTEPFWGTRGRRGSSSVEDSAEEYPDVFHNPDCEDCYGIVNRFSNRGYKLNNDDNIEPFWGVRGKKESNEFDDSSSPFWGNRGRRQDDDPFWGARGRRKDEPFWGARGRRDDEPFWGTRGRRDDNEPFWGNRGRRQDPEPFWGTRGRRNAGPYGGNHGRRNEEVVLLGELGRHKENLKESILSALNHVENDIEHLSRLKKSESSFWSNRGRDSKLKSLFSGTREKFDPSHVNRRYDNNDPGTLTDSRMYADEPNFILVERNSRSSGEMDDPFMISRGKKYLDLKLFKAARDRRGALEEIVKSVRNDPYYIARGKKDDVSNANSTNGELSKVKELICAAVDLSSVKGNGKVKREIDTDRDRRTILKKLTAQLQNDPYFVSRGKKSDSANKEDYLREFITDIAKKC